MKAGSFDVAQRRLLEDALERGADLTCPVCGIPLAVQPVAPPAQVSYVRHRVLAICPECRRSAGLDVKRPS